MGCKQMVHCCPKTVYICSGISLSMTAILFRCRISLSSKTCRILNTLSLILPCSTKIKQYNVTIRLKHYIGRLHIPVYDCRMSGMKIPKHTTQLLCPVNHAFLRLRTIFINNVLQCLSFYEVHYNKEAVLSVNNINDTWKMRVIKPLKHISLNNKALLYHIKIL